MQKYKLEKKEEEDGREIAFNGVKKKKNHSECQQQQRSGILKTKALKEILPIYSQICIKIKYLGLEKIKDQKAEIMFV